jgi:hypothetical protein
MLWMPIFRSQLPERSGILEEPLGDAEAPEGEAL